MSENLVRSSVSILIFLGDFLPIPDASINTNYDCKSITLVCVVVWVITKCVLMVGGLLATDWARLWSWQPARATQGSEGWEDSPAPVHAAVPGPRSRGAEDCGQTAESGGIWPGEAPRHPGPGIHSCHPHCAAGLMTTTIKHWMLKHVPAL